MGSGACWNGVMWMAGVYYVDAAVPSNKKSRKQKAHAVFDGDKTFKVYRLTKLEDAGEIFIDTLFPEIYDEVLELLRKGVRVYLLKDIIKLKKLRMENNMEKSDESDAMLLSRIPREEFRPLAIEELELKMRIEPLIRKYRQIIRWEKILKRLAKRGLDYNFREVVRLMNADRQKISEEIIRQVTSLPIHGEVYRRACEILGVKRSAELAILAVRLPLHLPMVRLKGLLGLIPGGNGGRYNHELRAHIASFAATLYMNAKRHVSASDKVAEAVNCLPKKMALCKLQLMTVKALRIAYIMTVKPLVGE